MVQSAKYWVGSVLISECSAKSKHEHTYRKPDTPLPFLSSVLMEHKLPGAAMWMQWREKKQANRGFSFVKEGSASFCRAKWKIPRVLWLETEQI